MARRKKLSELEQLQESKNIRLNAMGNKTKVAKIRETEEQWRKLKLSGKEEDLLIKGSAVRNYVHGAATRWGRLYKKDRLTIEDFLSEFYLATWDVITKYTWATEFFLYEMIVVAIQSRGKNLLRNCLKTDKRRVLHEALPLSAPGFEDEEFHEDENTSNMAEVVVDNLFREQIMQARLTDSERRVLVIVFEYEKAISQRKLATETGLDRRVVSQTVEHLRHKLGKQKERSSYLGGWESAPSLQSTGNDPY